MPGSMEATAFLDSLVLAITHLGSGPGVISLTLLYTWWIDPSGGRKLGILLGLSWMVNLTLKEVFALPRPYQVDAEAATEAARATGRGPGFPSGHTQATTTFWVYLAGLHRRRWLWIAAAAMMAAVGFSRIWLGVHFPLDILGGLAVGPVLAVVGLKAPAPRCPPPWVAPLAILAVFPAVLAGKSFAEAAGLTVGLVLSPGDHRIPRTRMRRLGVAVGGLVVLWGLYLALGPLMERLPSLALPAALAGTDAGGAGGAVGASGIAAETWGGYLRAAGLTLFAFGLWPRWVLGVETPPAAAAGD